MLEKGTSNQVTTLRRTTSYVDDQNYVFVGLQDVVQKLLDELLRAEAHPSVISIYGMGGLGKTTLARNLYINPNIVNSFHMRAWICAPEEYNTVDVLKNIIKSTQSCSKEILDWLEKMTERDLEIYLRALLKKRKYLVVVDDLWHREAWESLKKAFRDGKKGSRVIITTRRVDIAKRADEAMVPKMEQLARDMVEKCEGLPLSIVVLSGLLSHKRGLDEWKKVKDHLWKNIIEDECIEILNILSFSYNDLSTALKQCFLYFGIFPKDQVVEAENIIRLWMAEGFIPRGEERMEDVAEGFLNELKRRSLVQVVDTFWEKVEVCSVHDLLHDLAIQKALERRSSKFYRADRRGVYHSNSVRHDTEDCINLKHKIQDLIDQRVVTLQTVAPSINSNPLPNYEGTTINMIETEDKWCMTKMIVPTGLDNLEKVVASPSISEKLNFTITTPHRAFALMSGEGQNKKGIDHVPPKSLPHLRQSFLVEEYANDDGLGEGIRNLCEEGDVAPKKMIETPGIRDAEPMEQVLNWTSTPLLISRSS
ncbi:hypothetical protein KY285_019439 [Solanum tuberosum]|nr:hypothetical protein KY285_019439 [Solanum tuberosum]